MKLGKIEVLWPELKLGVIIGDEDGEEVGFANGSLKGLTFSQLALRMAVAYCDVHGTDQLYANTVTLPTKKDDVVAARERGWKEGLVVATTSNGGVVIGPGGVQVWYGNLIVAGDPVAAGQAVWYLDKQGGAPGSREATWIEARR